MRGVCAETMAFAHDGWDEEGTRGNGRREEWREGRHQRILRRRDITTLSGSRGRRDAGRIRGEGAVEGWSTRLSAVAVAT